MRNNIIVKAFFDVVFHFWLYDIYEILHKTDTQLQAIYAFFHSIVCLQFQLYRRLIVISVWYSNALSVLIKGFAFTISDVSHKSATLPKISEFHYLSNRIRYVVI